jgi:hypothetical protein
MGYHPAQAAWAADLNAFRMNRAAWTGGRLLRLLTLACQLKGQFSVQGFIQGLDSYANKFGSDIPYYRLVAFEEPVAHIHLQSQKQSLDEFLMGIC